MSTLERDAAATTQRTPLAAGLDTAAVVLFVAVGRRNHDEDPGLGGLAVTAAPFLIALAVTWFVVRAWNRPIRVRTGVAIWLGTAAGGLALRRLAFGEGIALPFVVVATMFLGATLLGWRSAALALSGRRTAP